MRVIDYSSQLELKSEPDLNVGYLVECLWAPPEKYNTIDNETKFALDDSDYETVQLYTRYTDEELAAMNAEDPQAVTDAAICELYEMIGALQNG
jgi:hypothetical protein